MLIIPALYLVDGLCVSPYKGDKESTTVLSNDPLNSARRFEKQGATHILVIDGDRSEIESKKNRLIAAQIAKNTKLSVIFADGVGSLDEIEKIFSAGIFAVAVRSGDQKFLADALERFSADKIWFLVHAQRNIVEGTKDADVVDFVKRMTDIGLKTIIFWDTKTEGTFHPNYDEIERLVLGTPANIIAFGGIGDISDIALLQKTGARGIVLSRALFERRISLRDCITRFAS